MKHFHVFTMESSCMVLIWFSIRNIIIVKFMMTSSNVTFSALLALCAGNSPVTGEFPSQRPVTRSFMFSLICAWINGWVNNREAADLRRHRAHYDVILVCCWYRRWISVVLASVFPRRCMKLLDDILGDITRTDIHVYVDFQVRTYIYYVELNADIHIFDTFKFYTWLSVWIISAFGYLQATYWEWSMLCSTNVCLDVIWIWIRFGYGFQGIQTVIISCGCCAERKPYYAEKWWYE